MRPAPDIIAALVATELTTLQVTLLLELVSVMSIGLSSGSQVESPDDAIARRRKYDREYKAKRRKNAKSLSGGTSSGMSTGQVEDVPTLQSRLSSNEVVLGKKETALVVEGQKPKTARGTRLAADEPLTVDFINAAIGLGMHHDAVIGAWAEFVDYWAALPGQRGLKLNWLLTWRNRVRQLASKNQPRQGQGNGRRSIHDAGRDLAADVAARVQELDRPAPSGLRDATGERPVRLLSSR